MLTGNKIKAYISHLFELYSQLPRVNTVSFLGVAQPGSALAWGARGRRFKSSHPEFLPYKFEDYLITSNRNTSFC